MKCVLSVNAGLAAGLCLSVSAAALTPRRAAAEPGTASPSTVVQGSVAQPTRSDAPSTGAPSAAAPSTSTPSAAPPGPPSTSAAQDQSAAKSLVVETGFSRENLTGGRADWHSRYLLVIKRFATRKALYGTLTRTRRFGLDDNELLAGAYYPLGAKWTAHVEASASPTHRVLPRWTALGELSRDLGRGRILNVGLRRRRYDTARVDIGTLGAEQYFGHYRAAYTLLLSRLQGSGSAATHLFQANRYYGDNDDNSIGISLAVGREVENLEANRLLEYDVRDVRLSGLHWISRRWAVSYSINATRLSGLYNRSGVSLGLRRRF